MGGGGPLTSTSWEYEGKAELLTVRKKVLDKMHSSLKKPFPGPDFGGDSKEGEYLTGYGRYGHGSFIGGLKGSGADLEKWAEENRLFFISALYGLVHFREPIQNYDLDLSDGTIYDEWKTSNVCTKALLDYLSRERGKVDCIINCCSNVRYSSLIDWIRLSKKYEVRHVVANGKFEPRQVRWSCGYMSGASPETLIDLILDNDQKYITSNGVIKLVERFPKEDIASGTATVEVPAELLANNLVAVACLEDEQYASFIKHARKNCWDRFLRFEKVLVLDKKTIDRLHAQGCRATIMHVDASHKEVMKAYQFSGSFPEGWQYFKVTHNSYSDIRIEAAVRLKKHGDHK
jgi:hypothetical protein